MFLNVRGGVCTAETVVLSSLSPLYRHSSAIHYCAAGINARQGLARGFHKGDVCGLPNLLYVTYIALDRSRSRRPFWTVKEC